MAILGRIDASTFSNNVGVTNGSATVSKNAADVINQGDIIELATVPYLVKQVNSDTEITLHIDYAGSTNASLSGAVRRTAPKAVAEYIIKGGDSATYELVFVDNTEQAVSSNKSRGIWGPGWWKYRTFVDSSGNTRHKAECIAALQATAAVAGDDADDTIVADSASTITISGQPSNQSTSTPAGGILTFTEGVGTTLAGEADETYTAVAVTGGTGNDDATFTVVRDNTGAIDTVTLVDAGSDYTAADTLTILGSDIGGDDTTDDLTITVDTVATAAATFSVTASADAGSVVYQWQVQTASGTRWTNISGATSASLALTGLAVADNGKKYRVKLTSTAGADEVISNSATLTVTAA